MLTISRGFAHLDHAACWVAQVSQKKPRTSDVEFGFPQRSVSLVIFEEMHREQTKWTQRHRSIGRPPHSLSGDDDIAFAQTRQKRAQGRQETFEGDGENVGD